MADRFEVIGPDGTPYEVEAGSMDDAVAAIYPDYRMPDMPELYSEAESVIPTTEVQQRNEKIRAYMSAASGPEEETAIFLEFFPDADVLDVGGYAVAKGTDPLTGEEFHGYLNKPGLSQRDVTQALTTTLLFTPGGKAANAVARSGVFGMAAKMGISFGAEAMSEAARQVAVDQLTAYDVPFSPGAIAMAGLGGAAGEPLGEAISWLSRTTRNPFYVKNGQLTERGREVFSDLGVDPDIIDTNPDLLSSFRRTPGMPRTAATTSLAHQRPDLLTQSRMTGRVEDSTKSLESSRGAVGQIAQEEATEVEYLYETARLYDATMPGMSMEEAFASVQGEMGRASLPVNSGPVKRVLRDFETEVMGGGIEGLDANSLLAYHTWRKKAEATRRQLSPKRKAAERRAISTLTHRMDRHILRMFDEGLARGDEAAVRLWNQAIKRNAQFAEKWTSNYIIEESILNGRTAEEVNRMLTISTAKPQVRQEAFEKIKAIVGEDSAAWEDLKNEYVYQLLRRGQKDMDTFDPVRFKDVLTTTLQQDRGVLNAVLSSDEINILKDLARANTITGRKTLMSAIADLVYLRYGIQGHAIAGAFRRTAMRLGFEEQKRPLFAQLGVIAGSVAGRQSFTPLQQAVGEQLERE